MWMARIVISSLGTLGDFVPFVALGKALKQRGHAVLVAVNEAMHELFQRAGLEVTACGPRFGPEESRCVATAFDGWQPYTEERRRLDATINDVRGNYRDLRAACRGADLLVAVSIQLAAPLVRKALGIPWVCVHCNAEQLEHDPDAVATRPLPDAELILLASSPHFSQPRIDLYPRLRLTGFWFDDGTDQPGWSEPSAELRRFVEDGERPLVLLPGSIPSQDPRHVVSAHCQAAARLQRRLVIRYSLPGICRTTGCWRGRQPSSATRLWALSPGRCGRAARSWPNRTAGTCSSTHAVSSPWVSAPRSILTA
jgi:hypothetical protein